MEQYFRIPKEITLETLRSKNSWSCNLYKDVIIPTSEKYRLKDLLDNKRPYDLGGEPGSLFYLQQSNKFLIRTKGLQDYSNLIYPHGDSIQPINPRIFVNQHLSEGDILISKDSNIGECVYLDGENWKDYMFSGGIVRIRPKQDKLYIYSFLKHPLFKEQLLSMVPRGATIKHAKNLFLNCYIPYPNQSNREEIIRFVSLQMSRILGKEIEIKRKTNLIQETIDAELGSNQGRQCFTYNFPELSDIKKEGRLDARIFGREYKSKIWLIENYKGGWRTPSQEGFSITPGPSLEIKIIKTRVDSNIHLPGFYTLIIPRNISIYGTVKEIVYLGTAKELPLLRKGDVLFGEAGFHKGRSIVLLENIDRCTTNAHGLYARREDGDIRSSIFFRCIFDWYRSQRLIDLMAVGGSGGHFSPQYFDYLKIPRFPDVVKDKIVNLYHQEARGPKDEDNRNLHLGICELDREKDALTRELSAVQDQIIGGKLVSLPSY